MYMWMGVEEDGSFLHSYRIKNLYRCSLTSLTGTEQLYRILTKDSTRSGRLQPAGRYTVPPSPSKEMSGKNGCSVVIETSQKSKLGPGPSTIIYKPIYNSALAYTKKYSCHAGQTWQSSSLSQKKGHFAVFASMGVAEIDDATTARMIAKEKRIPRVQALKLAAFDRIISAAPASRVFWPFGLECHSAGEYYPRILVPPCVMIETRTFRSQNMSSLKISAPAQPSFPCTTHILYQIVESNATKLRASSVLLRPISDIHGTKRCFELGNLILSSCPGKKVASTTASFFEISALIYGVQVKLEHTVSLHVISKLNENDADSIDVFLMARLIHCASANGHHDTAPM
ncbi:hypothetical protein F4604DRAFT_1683723 [Suillus subluteus]|nr:hypothetical protein F4604DRAFT_1683723 [Suillus subluteus]